MPITMEDVRKAIKMEFRPLTEDDPLSLDPDGLCDNHTSITFEFYGIGTEEQKIEVWDKSYRDYMSKRPKGVSCYIPSEEERAWMQKEIDEGRCYAIG